MKNQQNINQESAKNTSEEEALGIKNPLLTPTTLGQNFLSLQSISPLGSRSINLINWSLISPNQTLLQNFQDNENWQDSDPNEFRPFTKNSLTENLPIIEPPSDKIVPPSIPIQLFSESPLQQPTETPSSDSELPRQQPAETIFPFRIDQKTQKNSITQNIKSSTSHLFQKKSEFPREKIVKKEPVDLSKDSDFPELVTPEVSDYSSLQKQSDSTINPTDIINPEIPNYSPLQKQPDSTVDNIRQTESPSIINPTDIINPEIPNYLPIQKQPDSTINPTDIVNPEIANNSPLQKQPDSTVDNIRQTESPSIINPGDIIDPEIPNYSSLQKQSDSTINPEIANDSSLQKQLDSTINPTDIINPEIANDSSLQKQLDSTINPTDIINPEIPNYSSLQKQPDSKINPTDIVNPEIPNYSPIQKQADFTVDNISQTESPSIINPTDIINPEIPNYLPIQKQPDSTINPTDIVNPEIANNSPLQKQSDSTVDNIPQTESPSIINLTKNIHFSDTITPENPVSPLQKQTENQTVAQLLKQPGAIPQLPQVLENITTSQPLGISQPLVQTSKLISENSFLETNPMLSKNEHENVSDNFDQFASLSKTNIQPKSEPIFNNKSSTQGIMIQRQESDFSTSDVPDSWSSIEELLGESNSTPSEPTVVQAFSEKEGRQAKHQKRPHRMSDIRTGMLLPPGITRGVAGIHSLDLQQQPTPVKALMEKTIQTRLQQEQKTASRKAEPVQTLTPSNIGMEESRVSLISEVHREETKQAETKTDQVEVLAREIYGLVRQRFEIERERRGFIL
ncbi:MAG: hypothetical protein RSE13_06805 [Planktothrix sp. GU0601_MAG3]|nr:MAG: hypothetical protein RSE13_06805 [Planktothrix sp. GU0601_MAG3]